MKIKAISLWEPWASAMREGLKCIETRSFDLSYRGPLAIHHAKKPFRVTDYDGDFIRRLQTDGLLRGGLQFGVVSTIVEWWDSRPTHLLRTVIGEQELFYGNYEDRRFGWLTRGRIVLPEAVPTRGFQGLFDWEVPPQYEQLVAPGAHSLFPAVHA